MKILVALDASPCSEAALAQMLRQFKSADTEALLLYVDDWPNGVPVSFAFAEGPAAASDFVAIHDERRRKGEDLTAGAASRLKAAGFRVSTEIRQGDPQREILECAARWRPDVIVIGSHGRKGLNRLLLGSVSDSVLRHATCTVEVVRAPAADSDRVGAAGDRA